MKSIILFILVIITSVNSFSQTNPQPFKLSAAAYYFNEWSDTMALGTYPSNMIFQQSNKIDPLLQDEMTSDWKFFYNLTSKSRINGCGKDGISFINTADTQTNGGGYLGAAVLALDTRDCQNISVSWRARTISSTTRPYAIALQYRIDSISHFDTIPLYNYPMNLVAGSDSILGPIILSNGCENQPYIQLRWKYYSLGSGSGRRAELGLDDIIIKPNSTAVSELQSSKENNGLDMKSISPNPVKDNFILDFDLNCPSKIIINLFDIFIFKKIEVFEEFLNSGKYSIPVSILQYNLQSGCYTIQAIANEQVYYKSLLIVR
jgi:hypothetical protein